MTLPETLTFGETPLSIIDRKGVPWLQARDVGRALGYSTPDKVLTLFERNKDEFSEGMTATLEMRVGITPVTVRIFSPRGCHLLAMFARTPRAKEFRRWVLDVLDRVDQGGARPKRIPAPALSSFDMLSTASDESSLFDREKERFTRDLYAAYTAAMNRLRRVPRASRNRAAVEELFRQEARALQAQYDATCFAAHSFSLALFRADRIVKVAEAL